MIIKHNMNALNTLNALDKSNSIYSKAMERLSSGHRINKAADDAAGLSISEKMKAQIRGLEQASRNVQDGISLVQTAEGGLSQIENPNLQRLRELSVQAANGTLSKEDRETIQKEVNQILQGIDDIANYTEFNTIKVLRPPIAQEVTEFSGAPTSGKADIVFVIDDSASMGGAQNTVAENIEKFVDTIKAKGVTDIRMGLVNYEATAIPINFNVGKWTSSTSEISDAIKSFTASRPGTENLMKAIDDTLVSYDFRSNEGGSKFSHIVFVTNEDADDELNLDSTLTSLKSKEVQVHGVYQFNSIFGDDVTELDKLTTETGGKSLDLNSASWGNDLSAIIGAHIGEVGNTGEAVVIEEDKMPTLKLQVGANSGQTFDIELFDARTSKLGIKDIKVDPFEKAEEAIGLIDKAIHKVSSQRAKFGAYQNALEHIGNNVSNYELNLTSAVSRITDADMAKEIMNMTKGDILSQAAQSLLKQAEEMPKGVLNLIQQWGK